MTLHERVGRSAAGGFACREYLGRRSRERRHELMSPAGEQPSSRSRSGAAPPGMELNRVERSAFAEDSVFRIDRFLREGSDHEPPLLSLRELLPGADLMGAPVIDAYLGGLAARAQPASC